MKNKNLKTISMILFTVFIASTFSTNAFAQRKLNKQTKSPQSQYREMNNDFNHSCNIPNLTDNQIESIKKLRTKHMKKILPIRNQLREKNAKLTTLITQDKMDNTAIDKIVDDISDLRKQMMKNRISHKNEIRNILTDEQKVYFNMHSSHRKGQKHGMGPRKGMNQDNCQGYHRR
ncbi:MAG: Spy/CpxP family protein refolding chaperone [Bacteroidota bacterium]|nr:Spy/CpxP family protein refolding chaperone [Bacteroidota bacterium]